MRAVLEHLEGQLTATLHMNEGDTDDARALLPEALRRKSTLRAPRLVDGVMQSE